MYTKSNSPASIAHAIQITVSAWLLNFAIAFGTAIGDEPDVLPGTKHLTEHGDFSERMVRGIDTYLTKATEHATNSRIEFWNRDFSSPSSYTKSVDPNRRRLQSMIGAVDRRIAPVRLEYVSGPDASAILAETDTYRVFAIRWTVFEGVDGEGLLLEPRRRPQAQIVALPDANQTPEMLVGLEPGIDANSQFARRFAEAGCRVIVPVLIDRRCDWSGNSAILLTNQTHREWVYRQAFEMGRHIIGYEVQKVMAAVDWFASQRQGDSQMPIGVTGYGEGGLIALYSAAIDSRVKGTFISGHFGSRNQLWKEPIYRNVFGLLREFGDAEIASLIAPRTLVVEHSRGPEIEGPPASTPDRRACAAPGRLITPSYSSVRGEVGRAIRLISGPKGQIGKIHFVAGPRESTAPVGSDEAVRHFLKSLSLAEVKLEENNLEPLDDVNHDDRQQRQIRQLMEHSQRLLRNSERIRAEFWNKAKPTKSLDQWADVTAEYRQHLWTELWGRLPNPSVPANPRTRMIEETAKWKMYEVVLDVWPDVFAWGYLLVPKSIKSNQRRPVVVCQHGLEGLPESVVTRDEKQRAFRAYQAYAARLADRGFVVYAPHNPYRGETAFRQLQRKANPLKLTLFSFIVGQHQRTLQWLGELPFVDAERIAFYGLSYGGTSAMRIPSVLDGYCLSICSACFNDWTRKIMSLDFRSSYMFTREYEQFSFNLGSTFNHAEMAALIAPRPFMVERGHRDGVAPDEWVAYEYAKVRRLYADLGIAERTAIEFFDGAHEIHGQGTFDFLHEHLKWPNPAHQNAK